MIRLQNVSKTYRTDKIETLALKDIDLQVAQGEFVAMMGPSGCGKSTLLNIIGLLDRPGQGSIEIGGRALAGMRDRQLAQLRNQTFGFVFQSFHLIPDLRAIDNVELPLLYRSMGGGERRRRARAALEKVGLGARMDHYPNQLSGGQQQRVAIARAIVGQPQVLLADEPTGNLDSRMGEEVMDILLQLNAEGTTVVMVTHDEQEARRTHRIVRVFDGQLVHAERPVEHSEQGQVQAGHAQQAESRHVA
jgi:putative ABC transport system ATP-binding protein